MQLCTEGRKAVPMVGSATAGGWWQALFFMDSEGGVHVVVSVSIVVCRFQEVVECRGSRGP